MPAETLKEPKTNIKQHS